MKRWVGYVVCVTAILVSVHEVSDVKVSDTFAKHIERVEGFSPTAYRDVAGILTIGFGHVILPSEAHLKTATLTREEATELLRKDTKNAELAVNAYVKPLLRQEQFDALVSFTFNVGTGAFRKSTLLKKLNAGHCCAVPDEMRKWKKSGGKVVQGLVNRREIEVALYTGAEVG